MPSDGNCLYAAIVDQVTLLKDSPLNKARGSEILCWNSKIQTPRSFCLEQSAANIAALRRLTAAHIRAHPDDFLPFIIGSDEVGDAPDPLAAYCTKLESTPMWGGQIELQVGFRH